LENVLEGEIKQLHGVSKISKGKGGVSFTGTTGTGLEALLWLRSALKVMEVIGSTDSGVDDKDDLYAFCQSLSWQTYLTSALTFKIETVFGQVAPAFNHQLYTSLTVKHAITDGWSKGAVPVVSLDDPDVNIFLYLHRGSAIVYRVWSGDTSLHKRGYREVVHKAALRETTAAALLLAAGWRTPKSNNNADASQQNLLCDPMCGSATFLLEAALILADVAPGLLRYSPDWGQPHPIIWPDLIKENTREQWKDHVTAAQARDQRQALSTSGKHKLLHGNDVNANAIQLAARSAELAGVGGMISLSTADVDRLDIPPPQAGVY
jgi:23S rRNA (guanine2445-N2)-methyltransferase / 23S rRNA (guanine2069-N7)-methyltransferase